MAGVPCMEIAFWGPAYDVLYHTTGDIPDVLDPKAFHANSVFNALALLRFDQMGIVDVRPRREPRRGADRHRQHPAEGPSRVRRREGRHERPARTGWTPMRRCSPRRRRCGRAPRRRPMRSKRVNGIQMAGRERAAAAPVRLGFERHPGLDRHLPVRHLRQRPGGDEQGHRSAQGRERRSAAPGTSRA